MLNELKDLSHMGEVGEVWIDDMRRAFESDLNARPVYVRLECLDGTERRFFCPLPRWGTAEERGLILEYLKARVFNIMSCFSGRALHICLDMADAGLRALALECLSAFEAVPGLKKTYNIAQRLCRGLGYPPFRADIEDAGDFLPPETPEKEPENWLAERLMHAVEQSMSGAYCGIDVGGTDIKLAAALDGRLLAVKEFDWNPAESRRAEDIIQPILLLARLMRAAIAADALPEDSAERKKLLSALRKDADIEEMEAVCAAFEAADGLPLFSGVGVSFPDVVISGRILGGETPKTMGMRENPDIDYESEFEKLSDIGKTLKELCLPEAEVRIINDGTMAAFSAAAELAHQDAGLLKNGIIAHTLGTDLGTGWLTAGGRIPEIPLELYDLMIDLGSAAEKALPPEDMRSVRNENSGLAGMRRYLGQAAAYRLAYEIKPGLLDGFVQMSGGCLSIKREPRDMRKPCLEHLMSAAAENDPAAGEVFRRIGVNLARLTREMEYLLSTGTGTRYIFGRFVKEKACFELIKQGFNELLPEYELRPADDSLALSPLMRRLSELDGVSVAQFAQAVGAIYFSKMGEGQE